MSAALAAAAPLLCCWLATARLLYARWQGNGVSRRDCQRHGEAAYRSRLGSGCCYDEAPLPDGVIAALAMAAAVFFPLVLAAAAVRWQPHPRQRLAARRSRRGAARAIALRPAEWEREVEQEVGLGDDAR